jgi:preprotein translocase subunit Sec63
MKDFYIILGVEPDASPEQIKKMYHKLSKKYHPDANIADPDLRKWSEIQMKELNQAYNTLRDPVKRARYDRRWGFIQTGQTETQRQPVITPQQGSFILRGIVMSAISFGLVGLVKGGFLIGFSAAALGIILAILVASVTSSRLPFGVILGGLIGAFAGLLFNVLPLGLLAGLSFGAFAGGWLESKN